MRRYQALRENLRLDAFGTDFLPRIECPHSLEQRFFESSANGHHLAHRFHLRAEALVSSGELFELPLGNFDDYVIECRLEAGGSLASDVVGNLVERVADRELGGDFGDREPGGFRG